MLAPRVLFKYEINFAIYNVSMEYYISTIVHVVHAVVRNKPISALVNLSNPRLNFVPNEKTTNQHNFDPKE